MGTSLKAQRQELLPLGAGLSELFSIPPYAGSLMDQRPLFLPLIFTHGVFTSSLEKSFSTQFLAPNHDQNLTMERNINPREATISLPAPLTSFPSDCAPSSLLTHYICRVNNVWQEHVLVGFSVPRLPAQEALLFGGMLNPLGFSSLFSAL